MTNSTKGPRSWHETVNAAHTSQSLPAGGYTNTNGWHWQVKEIFYGNGGR